MLIHLLSIIRMEREVVEKQGFESGNNLRTRRWRERRAKVVLSAKGASVKSRRCETGTRLAHPPGQSTFLTRETGTFNFFAIWSLFRPCLARSAI